MESQQTQKGETSPEGSQMDDPMARGGVEVSLKPLWLRDQ